ncbi:molybdopterin guanine dinucleotide biosynthesis accessory protein MobB [Desulfacinum hydrothermale DSM 13146]|uniref:Molybdopterin guanine dinucleotide biosynthesis accessory protein MobB n=1 Tax=Desulfacinum hydrothermale DSM 13146 TaxID=1121390 RepID=A0A1W1XLL1_9BACT|nr:molybdopterin-guanine dinucleotide biosynthesis protein B [Desulfacinum hydrothermale]SMC24833.1 molybdopterin guanine dinucleotide biosynthesis accessory protein MobB [Desulfacinum hydrothermale DSM 13146]
MVPVVCFVGKSNVGKTTFLERLLPELVRRGYRVGTIKHDAHGFSMDREGKDTWRHAQAGAATIAIASPQRVASIRTIDAEWPLEEVVSRFFWDEDIVLGEGYKRSHFPKIEVFRSDLADAPLCNDKDNVIALVTDTDTGLQVPHFGFHQVNDVASFLEERYLRDRKRPRVLVQLDGKKLPMKDFVQDFVAGGVVGMLSQLRGWKKARQVRVTITMGEEE